MISIRIGAENRDLPSTNHEEQENEPEDGHRIEQVAPTSKQVIGMRYDFRWEWQLHFSYNFGLALAFQ